MVLEKPLATRVKASKPPEHFRKQERASHLLGFGTLLFGAPGQLLYCNPSQLLVPHLLIGSDFHRRDAGGDCGKLSNLKSAKAVYGTSMVLLEIRDEFQGLTSGAVPKEARSSQCIVVFSCYSSVILLSCHMIVVLCFCM